jgi:exodeoxyribonuclease V alpha subunit
MMADIIPTVTLNKIFRYSSGGLMRVATDTRCCKEYLTKDMKSKATTFGDNQDYMFIDLASEIIPKNVVALYKKLLSIGKTVNDIQVITAINKGEFGTVALNNKIQQVANKNYGSNERIITTQNNIDVSYYVGDLVIQKVNNYKATVVDEYGNEEFYIDQNGEDSTMTAFIANGEMGIIKHIFLSYLVVDYDGVYIKYDKSELVQIGLGYALTTHKVQGSASKIVILLTPNAHTFMLNSNLIYVGLTRMKERCFHLGNIKTVNIAIKKKANLSRNTFMQEILKSKCIND